MTPRHHQRHRQAGAALLAAMLTVTLVATFAAAALWQQWRASEVESAERARVQTAGGQLGQQLAAEIGDGSSASCEAGAAEPAVSDSFSSTQYPCMPFSQKILSWVCMSSFGECM